MVVAQLLCVVILATATNAENFTWQGIASSDQTVKPPARYSAAMGTLNGDLYLYGGRGNKVNGTKLLGDVWHGDLTTGAVMWTQLTAQGPNPRHSTVYGVMDTYLIITHGRGVSDDDLFDDTWAFDMETKQWMVINTAVSDENGTDATSIPEGRIDAAGGVWGNLLWLSMGRNKRGRTLSDLWILNITKYNDSGEMILFGEWVMLDEGVGYNQYDPFLPHARYKHAGAPLSDTMFVFFGGCASGGYVGGPCPLGDSWVYDRIEEEWNRLEDCSSPINDGVMISLSEGRGLLVLGDEEDGPGAYPQLLSATEFNTSDLSVVDGDNKTWIITRGIGSAFPSKRSNPSIARDGTTVFIFGGRSVSSKDVVMSDLWQLTWTKEDGEPTSCPGGDYFSFVHLHGVLMYLAWGLLLPLGTLLGRYYRSCWPFWFILHIIVQSLGVLMTVAGFVLIFLVGSYSEPNFAHAIIGIVLTAVLLQQFLNGIFHPCVDRENGKTMSEEKTKYRRCWEIYHATSGFLSIALGLGQVTLGVFLVVAPFEVWVTWCALGLAWIVIFFIHEVVFVIHKIYKRVKKSV